MLRTADFWFALILQALALQTRAGGAGGLPPVGVDDESYRLDDERTHRRMAGTAWVVAAVALIYL